MVYNLCSISCKRYPTPLDFLIKGDNKNAMNMFLIIEKVLDRFYLMHIDMQYVYHVCCYCGMHFAKNTIYKNVV